MSVYQADGLTTVSYLHRLLQYSVVKITDEDPKEANHEAYPHIVPHRDVLHGSLSRSHAVLHYAGQVHRHRSAPHSPDAGVPLHYTRWEEMLLSDFCLIPADKSFTCISASNALAVSYQSFSKFYRLSERLTITTFLLFTPE